MTDTGVFGKRIPAGASSYRPAPLDELREWGGARLVRGKRVLDVGCGDGRLALGVAPMAWSIEALDPDPDVIAAAQQAAESAGIDNARFRVGAAQNLPYADGSVDVVILSWTL